MVRTTRDEEVARRTEKAATEQGRLAVLGFVSRTHLTTVQTARLEAMFPSSSRCRQVVNTDDVPKGEQGDESPPFWSAVASRCFVRVTLCGTETMQQFTCQDVTSQRN